MSDDYRQKYEQQRAAYPDEYREWADLDPDEQALWVERCNLTTTNDPVTNTMPTAIAIHTSEGRLLLRILNDGSLETPGLDTAKAAGIEFVVALREALTGLFQLQVDAAFNRGKNEAQATNFERKALIEQVVERADRVFRDSDQGRSNAKTIEVLREAIDLLKTEITPPLPRTADHDQ